MRIRKIKKIVVILIVIAMLQTQIMSITNVVWAINMGITGENNQGEINVESEEVFSDVSVTEEFSDEVLDKDLEEISNEIVEGNITENVSDEDLNEEFVNSPKIELNIMSETPDVYKGYLYANITSELKYETNYTTVEEVKITGTQAGITNIVVKELEDKIKTESLDEIALKNDIYYKRMRVSVEEFDSILGENGLINIFDADEDFVGYINNQSPVENGFYVYDFIYYTNSIKVELSTPNSDGIIKIVNDKAIKEDCLYSKEEIEKFSVINVMANVEAFFEENVLVAENEKDINLLEPESKIEMELDKTELSTEDENDLTMTLTLKTDTERYELFKNPVIEAEMPSNINELSIEGINLLYRNGLSLKNWEVVQKENRNQVLRIELEGEQFEYTPGMVQQGTILVVYLKANVNKLTANTSETLKLTYFNEAEGEQSYVLEGKSAEEVLLKFVAKQGMLKGVIATNMKTSMIGDSYENEVDKVEVKSMSDEQIVTITGTIVNNFDREVTDVVILGRIPFIGNKNSKGEDLLSGFDTILKSEVITSGNMTEIYYSENGDATEDDVSWTQDVTDLSKYKSFKIVIKEGKLNKGEKVEFTYEVTVAENLGYNLKSYAIYTVGYELDGQEISGDCSIVLVSEEKELEAGDLENKEEIAELEIATLVTQGGVVLTEEDTVYERQIVRYTVVVTNPTNKPITNIKLTGKAENANMYNWKYYQEENYYGQGLYIARKYEEDIDGTRSFDELTIDVLNPGESKTFEYQAIAKALPEESENLEEVNIYGVITVNADDIEEKQIETIKNKIVDAKLELRIGYAGTEDIGENDAGTGGELKVYMYIKNISDETYKDLKYSLVIPDELDYELSYFTFGMEDVEKELEIKPEGKILTVTIPELVPGGYKKMYVSTQVAEYDVNILEKYAVLNAFSTIGDEKYTSNDYKKLTKQINTSVEYTWESDFTDELLKDGDEITYTLKVKNTGLLTTGYMLFSNEIPTGLRLIEVNLIKNNEEQRVQIYNEVINGYVELLPDEEVIYTLKYKVNENFFERDQSVIENMVSVRNGVITPFETEIISHKIHNRNVTVKIEQQPVPEIPPETQEPVKPNEPVETPEVPKDELPKQPEQVIQKPEEVVEEKKTYMISGRVWIDKNKDGIDNNELGEESVVVLLYESTSKGNLANKVAEKVTDKDGKYEFTGVENGTYIIVFMYDTGIYNSTKYKMSSATSKENSDAITKAMNISGVTSTVGVTDVITINDISALDIDLGLVNKNEFDLSLEKYVDSIKVKNEEGIKTYDYEEKESVKIDIKSKYYKNTTLEITYKIKVKNEGEVDAYINRIVDYVPSNMKFDNTKNADWYYGDDGNLYYKGLIGKVIAPNQIQEITLVLTKTLEDGESLKLVNGAEIKETTNSMGLGDKDSTPGNKETKEDDYGSVTLIVSVATGETTQNIIILLIILSMVIVIVYIAKFTVTKKVYR